MAEEKASQTEAAAAPVKGSKKMLMIIAAVMAVEGVGIFVAVKMFAGAPSSASASEYGDEDAAAESGAKKEGPEGEHAGTESGGHEKGGERGEKSEKGEKSAKIATAQTEIELPECRPSNKMTGKLTMFRMRVSILVATPLADKAKGLVEANKFRITDRINYVLRSAEPAHLNEPGLETIKRRIKQELDRILADDKMVQEVLIPELLQSGYGL